MSLRLESLPTPLRAAELEAAPAAWILLPHRGGLEALARLPQGELLARRLRQRERLAGPLGEEPWLTQLPNRRGTRVLLGRLPEHRPDLGLFPYLERARRGAAAAWAERPARLEVAALLEGEALAWALEAAARALLAISRELPRQRGKEEARRPPPRVRARLHGAPPGTLDLARLEAEAEANHLARRLAAEPPNRLGPTALRAEAQRLARRRGWSARFLGRRQLERLGAGAFLAVARADEEEAAGILHLRYRPRGGARARPALALVGKGVCFDTGGVHLKPARHMQHMHEDMGGAAVALAVLEALDRLGAPYPVDAWLALARNLVGPRAYLPGEVVRAADGTTIEIVHTDAEGRLLLADTLALAARERPGLILDFATLTGACIYALGSRYSGAFTNRPAWHPRLLEAGRASGERVWPFPMDPDYDRALESRVADLKQCTLEGEADHILAARFLARFVPEGLPWVHLDLAAARAQGGLGAVPTEVTGFGVAFALRLLLEEGLLAEAGRARAPSPAPQGPSRRGARKAGSRSSSQ
ncbi:MAG: leucyl aminopeptidase family protein [Gammaproteobacteria bacterium]|nr:MAG: leucyl aminopeptidase family protein [Gammaproteobacteria bacterium]